MRTSAGRIGMTTLELSEMLGLSSRYLSDLVRMGVVKPEITRAGHLLWTYADASQVCDYMGRIGFINVSETKDVKHMIPVKLGKKPPRFDPKTPWLNHFLRLDHLTAPPRQDWITASRISQWDMMLNDSLGDCVIAEKGHVIMLWTALTGKHIQVTLSDQTILQGYEAVGGYIPGQPDTDQGCDMLTAAQYFKTTGYGGHKIDAYASIDYKSIATIQVAVNLFGGVGIGLQMPLSAQSQTGNGLVWDVPPGGPAGDGAPGSWGGHDVPIMAYDALARMYKVITWGQVQLVSERFLNAYMDESLAYLSKDWIYNGIAPNKFNLAQLAADIATVNNAA